MASDVEASRSRDGPLILMRRGSSTSLKLTLRARGLFGGGSAAMSTRTSPGELSGTVTPAVAPTSRDRACTGSPGRQEVRGCAFIVEGLYSAEQDRAWPLASESRPSAATDIVENRWQHRAAWSKDSVAAENHAGAHAGQWARLHILIAEDSELLDDQPPHWMMLL